MHRATWQHRLLQMATPSFLAAYQQLKKEAQTANAKQAIMWDEAKK